MIRPLCIVQAGMETGCDSKSMLPMVSDGALSPGFHTGFVER